MVTSTTESYPDIRQTVERIATRTRDADNAAADVRELVLALFGDDQYANIFQVGMAVQVGGLPLSAAVIEDAITLNGVAVDRNIQAFRRGRQLVAEPTALISRLRADRPAESAPSEAARVVASKIDLHDEALAQVALARIDELIAYQDIAYAQVYAETIRRVQERSKHIGVASQPIVLSVARNLYKLMAYKDEYEVARLSIDPQLQRRLEAEFGVDAKYSYRLHPPVLRALGFDKKVVFGSWFGVVLRALYAMRGMRRSRLNPFGIGKLRSVERELVGEYVSAVETALGYLNSHNSGAVARLAELPDVVRGYEEVKLKNVANYRAEVCSLLSQLETASSSS
jgi:indolepyruvate ferredoxin oxidoreductase